MMAMSKRFGIEIVFVIFAVVWSISMVAGEPSFLEQPVDTSAILGDPKVVLKCAFQEIPGELIWVKDVEEHIAHVKTDDRTIDKETIDRVSVIGNHAIGEYHLQLENLTLHDDGIYRCYVPVNDSFITSTSAHLTVGRPPAPISIIGSPSISVIVGKAANLTCDATGANPPATMTWLRDGQSTSGALYVKKPTPNDASGKLSDSTSVLQLTPTMDDNGKTWECQATNMALDTPRKATITLDVQYSPLVTVQTTAVELIEGTSAVFQCVVQANPQSVTYAWSKNDEDVHAAETNVLTFTLTRDDHGANIKCAATNSIGTTEGSLTIDVKYGPKIIESPEGVSVDEGTPGSMQCTADGNPTPTIKWTRLGSRATLSTMTNLQFDKVRESDIGVYVCTATVEGFDPVVGYGRLDINGFPEIVSEPIQKAKVRGKAELDCFTGTKPDPHTVTWTWKNGMIQSGSNGRYSVTREETRGGVLSTLTIEKVREDDFHDYNCTMSNDVGSEYFIISLQPEELDLIIYVIIGVVSVAMFIFFATIIVMLYCRRRYKRRKAANKGKVDIDISLKSSDSDDSIHKPKRSPSEDSRSSTHSKPRYADPHDYVPARRGSRGSHNTWNDPIYHPTPYNPDWRDSYGGGADRFSRRSYSISNDYIEPEDLPHGTLPEWRDNFDVEKPTKPLRNIVDDKYDNYSNDSPALERRRSSKYRAPPTYDEFKDRYTEDDEYETGWPDADTNRRSSRRSTVDRRYSNDHIYSNDRYDDNDDGKDHRYDSRDRNPNYGARRDDGYDRLSNRGSDISHPESQDSKLKLATNV